MRARDAKYPTATQNVVSQPLGAGYIRQIVVEYGFKQGVAARNRIANHVEIRVQIHLVSTKTFHQMDALLGQLRAHRRVYIGVTTGDLMPGRTGQQRNSAHEGAANTQDVNMHRAIP